MTTPHHSIRFAIPEDAPGILEIYAPIVRDTHHSFETEIPTIDSIAERISSTLEHYPWLVLEERGRINGYAYASRHRTRAAYAWSVETSVYVHPLWQGHGVGTALYRQLLGMLRAQGFCNAYAGIALPNDPSIRLHRSLGFKPVGTYRRVGFKHDKWHDVVWMQRELQSDRTEPPSPAQTPSELATSPVWRAALRDAAANFGQCEFS